MPSQKLPYAFVEECIGAGFGNTETAELLALFRGVHVTPAAVGMYRLRHGHERRPIRKRA
jgi:hypothetical protein